MDPIVWAFICFTLGCVGKTSYDFLWKILEDPNLAFDPKYLVTMLVSILITVIMSPILFLNVTLPVNGTAYIMLTSFFIGFGMNHLINRPVSHYSNLVAALKERLKVQPSGPQS